MMLPDVFNRLYDMYSGYTLENKDLLVEIIKNGDQYKFEEYYREQELKSKTSVSQHLTWFNSGFFFKNNTGLLNSFTKQFFEIINDIGPERKHYELLFFLYRKVYIECRYDKKAIQIILINFTESVLENNSVKPVYYLMEYFKDNKPLNYLSWFSVIGYFKKVEIDYTAMISLLKRLLRREKLLFYFFDYKNHLLDVSEVEMRLITFELSGYNLFDNENKYTFIHYLIEANKYLVSDNLMELIARNKIVYKRRSKTNLNTSEINHSVLNNPNFFKRLLRTKYYSSNKVKYSIYTLRMLTFKGVKNDDDVEYFKRLYPEPFQIVLDYYEIDEEQYNQLWYLVPRVGGNRVKKVTYLWNNPSDLKLFKYRKFT